MTDYMDNVSEDDSMMRRDESPLTFEALTSNKRSPGTAHIELFGDEVDNMDELIQQKRNELYQIKARKQKARENPNSLNMEDLEVPIEISPSKALSDSSYNTPTKTSLTEIAHRVASNEKRLRTDRMRLTDLASNDVHQPRRETPRSHRSSPRTTPSPSHQKGLLGQKAIHKWHPESRRTQIPNQDTPLDIGLSSSEYDGHIGFAPDEEALAVTNSAKRRLKALTMEMGLDNHEDEAEVVVQQVLDFGKYLGEEQAKEYLPERMSPDEYRESRVFNDLQRKMDDMNHHLARLQEEKRLLERQQLEAERNAVDMSSSLRMLSAQVSQFLNNGVGQSPMNPRELHTNSHYTEDLMDELKMQRKLMGDLEAEINQWRHDADMLEQARVLEHQEHKSQFLQVMASNRVLEDKTDLHRDAIKALQEDAREWQHKLEAVWDRIVSLETRVLDHDKHLTTAPTPRTLWHMLVVSFVVVVVAHVLLKDSTILNVVLLQVCAWWGYDCHTPVS
ncbi:Aste57867_13227 [Aphanomyces stellatus]|uniref:Aste57867_13227 protein n=1 Tax=Aphanomyces stellatus TaxID=120398 RepID=A0A485KY97_9STRA|nr:hypothetical protein As57867_013178 [Aphanomyces stellatus]VFT90067.1 Aste57867_13227 [Aphanomyces stellatus]